MALRFNGSNQQLSRSASVPNTTTFQMAGWTKLISSTAAFREIAVLVGANFSLYLNTALPAPDLQLEAGANDINGTTTLPVESWRYVAFSRTGGTVRLRVWEDTNTSTPLVNTTASNPTVTAVTNLYFGGGTDFFNGELSSWRFWDGAELTDAELDAERRLVTPIKTTDLWASWRMQNSASAGMDGTSNARNLTVSGAVTTGASEPATLLSNVSITARLRRI